MASVTGFTAERLLAMEAATIVDGDIVGDNLILKRHDNGTIDAGNVRGPTGSPGISEEDFNAQVSDLQDLMSAYAPIGMIADYIGTSAPTKWLTMIGQTITNGQSAHPDLWAILPSSMKSGSDIVFPDTRGRVSVNYNASDTDFDAIGKMGGEKTHTLSTPEIPSHLHTVDPPNTTVNITDNGHNHSQNAHGHGISDPTHTHTQSPHNHTQDAHYHMAPEVNYGESSWFAVSGAPGGSGYAATAGPYTIDNKQATAAATASNQPTTAVNAYGGTGIQIINNTATNNGAVTGISAAVNIAQFNSGNTGNGGAHNNVQPYVTFCKIIKADL